MIGVALGLSLLLGAGTGLAGVVLCGGLAAIAMLIRGRFWLWTLGLVAFAIVGAIRVGEPATLDPPDWAEETGAIVGSVVSGPVDTGRFQRFDVVAVSEEAGPNADSVRVCVNAPLAPQAGRGDRVRLHGEVQWLGEIDGGVRGYLTSRGCRGSLFATSITIVQKATGIRAELDGARREIVGKLQRAVPGDTGALLAGLVMGDDAALDPATRDAFNVTGTSHVTAVSGSNLALIVVIMTSAGAVAGIARRWQWQLTVVVALWAYVALIGFSPPPIRAAGVATLAVLAQRLGRRPDFITISVLFAAAEVLWRPADFYSLAYRLSTVSSIALVLGLAGRSPAGWRGRLQQGVTTTAVTQLATSALLIPLFGRMTVYAIPANLVIGPLCAVAFPIAMLAAIVSPVSQSLTVAIAYVAAAPAWLTIESVDLFAGLPGAGAGSGPVGNLPRLAYVVVAIAGVIALSPECRGGLRRVKRAFARLETAARVHLVAATGGATIGLAVGCWLR